MSSRHLVQLLAGLAASLTFANLAAAVTDGVFVRFQLLEPAGTTYCVQLRGFLHNEPWYLAEVVVPSNAVADAAQRVAAGQFTSWFDVQAWAGGHLHGRHHRAGGIAEFPNITATFIATATNPTRKVVIELATAPDPGAVVKRFEESFPGEATSFLVSPQLKQDADSLETAGQMTARRLAWARAANAGGGRASPTNLIVETQLWGTVRPDLALQDGEVLWLSGFNVVSGQSPEIRAKYGFRDPGGHDWVDFGLHLTRDEVGAQMKKVAAATKPAPYQALFGFSDEIAAPKIGSNAVALAHFHAWLKDQAIKPRDLGVAALTNVVPIESPLELKERRRANGPAANRVFYWSTKFRQDGAAERIRWLTEAFRQVGPTNILTSTLVADHPYFAGSGFGMGMEMPNAAWGNFPLSLNWFDLARRQAVEVVGIEDWMGLQYMYGPTYTWEGFQLMGFQSAILRSGGRGRVPIIAWITPSDGTNIILKSSSALAQGAKHFFYWSYGPTSMCTENYWSDIPGAYDGLVRMTRQLAQTESIIAPGQTRPTRVALLYSLSADLWQPFGYLQMLERRLTYLALVHEQYLVDLVTEQDVEAGRLQDYDVLYVTDPNLTEAAMQKIRGWVKQGHWLYASTAAGSRNEFDEPVRGLADVFGIKPELRTTVQPGRYHIRGALNGLADQDQVTMGDGTPGFGAIGLRVAFQPTTAKVVGTFRDGAAAVVRNRLGKGTVVYVGGCPGLAYGKAAKFVPEALQEKWPAAQRGILTGVARESRAARLVELSSPVVEAGVFDASAGTALILGNFTYESIAELKVALPLPRKPVRVWSTTAGTLKFAVTEQRGDARYPFVARFTVPLGLNDIVVAE